MNDFISRTGLLAYLSKKCENESYTISDMLSDIEKYGKNGEVTSLPTLPKEFEVLKNLNDYGCWGFKHYPLTKAEAKTIKESMSELKKYRDSGLTAEQLEQVDEEYLKVVQKVPRWRTASKKPEKEDYYLTVSKFGYRVWKYKPTEDRWQDLAGFVNDGEVIAWQPLPEWEGEL